ncbi:MAG: GldG family protein, partial [Pseudomonadota bacterium]
MSRFRLPRLGRGIGRAQALSAAGVFAAAVLAVNVNWLSARTYVRWDFTSEGLYTLSQPTRELLRALDEPVDVVVLLSRADPLAVSVRHLLAAYRAETSALRVTSIDPDQQPAQFLAIQQKYGILSGKTEDGRIVTDASIVVARGDRHWFLTPDDLLRFDEEAGRVQPALEQALTEGIANVLGTEKATICFSRGHDELGLNDAGPEGLAELRNRIEKNNYAVEERDLRTDPGTALAGCRLLVVAGPKLRFGEAASASIVRAVRDGMSALVLASPTVDDDGRFSPSGLEPVAALAGAELANDLVLETDPGRRLPRGLGEVFFAEPVAHPVTRGLAHGGRPELDVLVSESRSIVPKQGAGVVLRTSDAAVSLGDVRPILEGRLGDV